MKFIFENVTLADNTGLGWITVYQQSVYIGKYTSSWKVEPTVPRNDLYISRRCGTDSHGDSNASYGGDRQWLVATDHDHDGRLYCLVDVGDGLAAETIKVLISSAVLHVARAEALKAAFEVLSTKWI